LLPNASITPITAATNKRGIAIARQRFHNILATTNRGEKSIAIQQFSKHNSAATNRGNIQEGVQYSVSAEVTKGKLQTVQIQLSSVQFTPVLNRAQSSEDRSEDPSARKGSIEYRNQKIEYLVYVL
jgi:hypothetical protein